MTRRSQRTLPSTSLGFAWFANRKVVQLEQSTRVERVNVEFNLLSVLHSIVRASIP